MQYWIKPQIYVDIALCVRLYMDAHTYIYVYMCVQRIKHKVCCIGMRTHKRGSADS